MKRQPRDFTKPIPVRLPPDVLKRVDEVSEKLGEPRSTVMRLALRIGLAGLEKALAEAPVPNLSSLIYPSKPDAGVELNEEKPTKKKAGS